KLETEVREVDARLDAVMGVAIEDLSNGGTLFLNPDEIFPQASSIKIAVLAELYHQHQEGKLKLDDLYTVNTADLVADSNIMGGLTPGVTRITNRGLATMMIAVSDNSATNVLIDRIGMENVNALLESLGLHHVRLQRKMMDLRAAVEGRENVATPREMMTLLDALYRNKVLNPGLTDDFFKMLSTPKDSWIPRYLPEDVRIANKPGSLEGVRTDSGVIFANRPCGSLDNYPPSFLHSRRPELCQLGPVARPSFHIYQTLATIPANLAHKRGGSMRILGPSLSDVLRSPVVLLLLTSILPVSV